MLAVPPRKHQSTPFRFKERVLQTPNDLLAAGFEEHKFQNFFNAVSRPGHLGATAEGRALPSPQSRGVGAGPSPPTAHGSAVLPLAAPGWGRPKGRFLPGGTRGAGAWEEAPPSGPLFSGWKHAPSFLRPIPSPPYSPDPVSEGGGRGWRTLSSKCLKIPTRSWLPDVALG